MNTETFHEKVGGRKKDYFGECAKRNCASFIRDLVVLCRVLWGFSNKELAEKIGFSSGTLSRACYGVAGKKIGPDGKSTTHKIIWGLVKQVIFPSK